MTLSQFLARWYDRYCEFDHIGSAQCVDLAEQYVADVLRLPKIGGNAADVWNRVDPLRYLRTVNGPTNFPLPGDIVVWFQNTSVGVGPAGHVGICVGADQDSLVTFDQNWPALSRCKCVLHSYTGVYGWLSTPGTH